MYKTLAVYSNLATRSLLPYNTACSRIPLPQLQNTFNFSIPTSKN